jgi:hypothetical protein
MPVTEFVIARLAAGYGEPPYGGEGVLEWCNMMFGGDREHQRRYLVALTYPQS